MCSFHTLTRTLWSRCYQYPKLQVTMVKLTPSPTPTSEWMQKAVFECSCELQASNPGKGKEEKNEVGRYPRQPYPWTFPSRLVLKGEPSFLLMGYTDGVQSWVHFAYSSSLPLSQLPTVWDSFLREHLSPLWKSKKCKHWPEDKWECIIHN